MLLPVALMTRAICWLADRSSGGVRVSSAVARTFRRGGPILLLSCICLLSYSVVFWIWYVVVWDFLRNFAIGRAVAFEWSVWL